MTDREIIAWLLEGDVSIQHQVQRDLLGKERPALQRRIANEGWGADFLSRRKKDGHWGQGFYQPKWTSTHYTLLDLRNLELPANNKLAQTSVARVLGESRGEYGQIPHSGSGAFADVCVNGMILNYASYFKAPAGELRSIVDFLLDEVMADGGFNCMRSRSGATHSSMHSTISVLEGFLQYRRGGYRHRLAEIKKVEAAAHEFLLVHKLFRSHRTGKIIKAEFLRLPYPSRWKYDIMRALDYFQSAGVRYDKRMGDALEVLVGKRRPDGRFNLQAKHAGALHFAMERAGQPSRMNTLRGLRILRTYGKHVT